MTKILIVDDDPDLREQMSAVLNSAGYETITANSGATGYEVALRERPDAAIVDLMMETDDAGFVLCHKLKANAITANMPLLMLTAVASITGFSFGLDSAGEREWIKADDFVDKPISPIDLLARLRKLLEK